MKNILVPFEFNKSSVEAFKYAIDLGARLNGKVTLLYAFVLAFANEALIAPGKALSSGKGLVAEGKRLIEARLATLEKKYSNSKCTIENIIMTGDDQDAIRRLVKSKHIDLVVIGNNFRKTSEIHTHWVAQNVIRNSILPVLIVKKAQNISSVKEILFPFTLQFQNPRIIRQLKEIQDFFKAKIHFLLVNTKDNFISEDEAQLYFKKFVRQHKLSKCETHFYSYRSEADGISHFAKRIKADLIVMPTHAREGFSRMLHGSVMERVLDDVKIPVVAMRIE